MCVSDKVVKYGVWHSFERWCVCVCDKVLKDGVCVCVTNLWKMVVTKRCVWQKGVWQRCVWKLVCDKEVCAKVVWQSCVCVCERWCVTKLCLNDCMWQCCVCVWQSCVWKIVCYKVVCERWCVTKMCVCVKDGVSQSCVCVCDKGACERWCVCVWQSWVWQTVVCVTKLWNMVRDKVVCERWCVGDGEWQRCVCVCVLEMVCDKDVCWRWCVTRKCVTKMCVKDGVWHRCVLKMVCDKVVCVCVCLCVCVCKDGVWQSCVWKIRWVTRDQSTPTAISATPGTPNAGRCRQVPRMPRKSAVTGVTRD